MRAVVDTNILVRALIKPQGSVGPVLWRLRRGEYTLLYSAATLTEVVDVLNRPRIRDKYRLTVSDIETVAALVLLRGEEITPKRRIAICRDPKDDEFLSVAVAGQADVLVTGDDDLLTLHPFEGIPIVTPAVFLQWLGPSTR